MDLVRRVKGDQILFCWKRPWKTVSRFLFTCNAEEILYGLVSDRRKTQPETTLTSLQMSTKQDQIFIKELFNCFGNHCRCPMSSYISPAGVRCVYKTEQENKKTKTKRTHTQYKTIIPCPLSYFSLLKHKTIRRGESNMTQGLSFLFS